MRIKGFQEKVKWQPSGQLISFSVLGKHPTADMDSLGPDLLRTFRNPTIFLKICCDGDFVLPIVVGTSWTSLDLIILLLVVDRSMLM